MAARQQPPWVPPRPHPHVELPSLKVSNGLTRRKDDFVPVDPEGKAVTWYTCGPTVYDDAHLGHARNYVSIDILRRIMRDYFGFSVRFVMNITDIDDKIILRGRQQYLLAGFKTAHAPGPDGNAPAAVVDTARAAFAFYVKKNLRLLPPDTAPAALSAELAKTYQRIMDGKALEGDGDPSEADAKLKMHIQIVTRAAEALLRPGKASVFHESVEDVLLPYLDSLHGLGVDSKNHAIFTGLTQKFERRFFDDMHSLNVMDPDVLTHVTDFVPQIVTFVQKIMDNGFAYSTPDGSVYFDIAAFERAGQHYARLEPWNRNDKNLQADGEGSLTDKTTAKRNDSDFALWKASKKGEPSWSSPWGEGRPGWHIECSVMASEVLGKQLDVHSGGIDLRFPHHDNELAQSEAYWASKGSQSQWVNYFLHTGHLGIQGMKMSKSLKNFTLIREALARPEWTARSIRIAFLLGAWQDGIEISEELLRGTAAWENRINNFFMKALDVAKNPMRQGAAEGEAESSDAKMLDALEKAKTDVDVALCDSFNTPVAMRALSDLVGDFNLANKLSNETVLGLGRWVTRMVTIFGLDADNDLGDPNRVGWSGLEIPEAAQPYIYAASQLRDQIRLRARSEGPLDHAALGHLAAGAKPLTADTATSAESTDAEPYKRVFDSFASDVKRLASSSAKAQDLLELCDQLRDMHLWQLGIYLEDRDPPLPALVRPVDKALQAAREERDSAVRAKAEAKARLEAGRAEKARLLEEKARVRPQDMFRDTTLYAEWDEKGIPTKEAGGEEVAKNKRKKLLKEWEKQEKLHKDWAARQEQA